MTETAETRAKPTPGPWKHTAIPGGWDGVKESGGLIICNLVLNNPANATFIAAAPDTAAERDRLLAANAALAILIGKVLTAIDFTADSLAMADEILVIEDEIRATLDALDRDAKGDGT